MTDKEYNELSKKIDKTLNLVTKIAKTLHLIPVTEKEEKEIQLLQRKNLTQAAKINSELNAMENKSDFNEDSLALSINAISEESEADIYHDIIGSDIMQ